MEISNFIYYSKIKNKALKQTQQYGNLKTVAELKEDREALKQTQQYGNSVNKYSLSIPLALL